MLTRVPAGAGGCIEGPASLRTSRFAALPARVLGKRTGSRCPGYYSQPQPGSLLLNVSAVDARERWQALLTPTMNVYSFSRFAVVKPSRSLSAQNVSSVRIPSHVDGG